MAKERLGSNAIFTGPQKGLTIIGEHCYAYSGAKVTSGTAVNFIEFTTGKHYIVAKLQPVYFSQGTNNISWLIKFNGQDVQYAEVTSGRDYTPFQEILLVIPPLTFVEVEVDNLNSGSELAGVSITGRVYE